MTAIVIKRFSTVRNEPFSQQPYPNISNNGMVIHYMRYCFLPCGVNLLQVYEAAQTRDVPFKSHTR